jgi:hypothetical protein
VFVKANKVPSAVKRLFSFLRRVHEKSLALLEFGGDDEILLGLFQASGCRLNLAQEGVIPPA